MKTQYKYIEFVLDDGKGTNAIWTCLNRRGQYALGGLTYYRKWRQWEFTPCVHTGFTSECLGDIADFIGQLKNNE